MTTVNQVIRHGRSSNVTKKKKKVLGNNPFVKGTCISIETRTPRKPNSALRKVTKVKTSTGYVVYAYIPGEKHGVQENSTVLLRATKVPDLPGVRYAVVLGAFDAPGVKGRANGRSKYGTSKK